MPSDVPPPKKPVTPSEGTPAPSNPVDIEQEAALQAGFTSQLDQKNAVKPKSGFHAAFGKMLGSEATAEQVERFVNTWVQDQLREMRKSEQKLHKTWRTMRP